VPVKLTLETLLGRFCHVLDLNRAEAGDATLGILFLREPIDQLILLSAVPSSLWSHHPQGYWTPLKMSPFAPPLISLFFLSGFAVAGLYAPGCSTTWEWVRMLSFLHSILWLLTDLVVFSPSHSILSGKMRVQLQRT
jgi:hypothetical protein